jgi:hypothetical protein
MTHEERLEQFTEEIRDVFRREAQVPMDDRLLLGECFDAMQVVHDEEVELARRAQQRRDERRGLRR